MLHINFVTYKECLYKECHGTSKTSHLGTLMGGTYGSGSATLHLAKDLHTGFAIPYHSHYVSGDLKLFCIEVSHLRGLKQSIVNFSIKLKLSG